MTQAQAGIRGSKAVRLSGRLAYELLSGHAPSRDADPQKYTPLPELDEAGNETLRRACVATDPAYPSCETFWNALKETLPGKVRGFTPASQPPPSISALAPSPPPGWRADHRSRAICCDALGKPRPGATRNSLTLHRGRDADHKSFGHAANDQVRYRRYAKCGADGAC
jgi:hypothetical protein